MKMLFYLRKLKESFKCSLLYRKWPFLRKIDAAFLHAYQAENPYRICRKYFEKKQVKDPFVYGETPLSVFYTLAKIAKISDTSQILDLGCGRGVGLFYLNALFGCKGIGIDCVPTFIQKASQITWDLGKDKELLFFCQDLSENAYPKATHVYLAGTCMEEALLSQIAQYLSKMDKTTLFITVSFALSDYHTGFACVAELTGEFLWGKTSLYLQRRI